MSADIADVERRLWSVADQLRANSGLKPSEYSRPVLGLLFLRYAEAKFAEAGSEVHASTPQQFAAHVKAEAEKWRSLIIKRGIKLD